MGDNTEIEWTDATWNPITGFTLVSEGCKNCYAAQLAATRLKNHPSRKGLARLNADGVGKFTGDVRFNEQWLDQPLHWKKPRMIFVCAHSDLFHEDVHDNYIHMIFHIMARAQHHTFQVLTKRPERMNDYLNSARVQQWLLDLQMRQGTKLTLCLQSGGYGLRNVWLGTSIEDQETANERIPYLLNTPAAVRWISAEPLLAKVDLTRVLITSEKLSSFGILSTGGAKNFTIKHNALKPVIGLGSFDWVVVGGESGKNARPMHPQWAQKIIDQCQAENVPVLFKQHGAWAPLKSNDGEWFTDTDSFIRLNVDGRRTDDGWPMQRVGKKHAGRTLYGETYDEYPQVIGGAE